MPSAHDDDLAEQVRQLRERVRQLEEAQGIREVVDDFEFGYRHQSDTDDPWVSALLAEHPELDGCILPGGTTVNGSPYEPRWLYSQYSDLTIDVEEMRTIAVRLGRAMPEGFTYKDVARALWGEDWTPADAAGVPGKLWGALRCDVRFEKIDQSKGPKLWRMRRPARGGKSPV